MKSLLILGLFTIVSSLAFSQSQEDKEAVRQVIIAFQNDFNKGDFINANRYSTDDWVHINPLGGIKKGRNEVLMEVREVHQTFLKNVSMTIDSITIRFVTPGVAIAEVVHLLSPYELPKGVKHENERHIKTYVLVKSSDRWLLTHDHNTIVNRTDKAD